MNRSIFAMTYKRRNYKGKVRSKFWLLGLFIFIATNVSAQLESAGDPSNFSGHVEVFTLPTLPKAMASESISQTDKLPLRFAHPFFVNLTPQNSGSWEEVDGGKSIWRLGIKSYGAKSLNLIFDRFRLMDGAKLFIYNTRKTQVLGAFTAENNKASGLFAIAPVSGDEIIIELHSKTRNKEDHELTISAINHDYLGVNEIVTNSRLKVSGSCNVDIACEGEQYEEIKRAVCKLIVDGTQLCSGTMVNNTNNDGKPYLLTAAHCFHWANNRENVVFLFNYEKTECNSLEIKEQNQTTSGATMLAIADTLDFALLEMQEYPPASYQPYWAGWDRSAAINGAVYSIHHPSGDVKKISIENESPMAITSNLTTVDRKPFVKDAHWLIQRWDKGTTEGGSSGGGLFSPNGFLIGSLSGGEATCSNPVNDQFARFNKYWDHVNRDDGQVAHWLDPNSTGIMSIEGRDYYEVQTQRLTHLEANSAISLIEDEDFKGFWSGHNSNLYDGYAEFYYEMQFANIHGVYLTPAKSKAKSDQTINLKIWDGRDGLPTNVLAQKNGISMSSLVANKENLIRFDPAVRIDGSFFVGVELLYDGAPVDTFALYNIVPDEGAHRLNRAYVRDNGDWKMYKDLHSSTENGMFWIDVLASDIVYTVGVNEPTVEPKEITISPNPIRQNQFTYRTNIKDIERIKLINLNGQVVYSTAASHTNEVNLPALPSGMYIVIFQKGELVIRKKVLVMPE